MTINATKGEIVYRGIKDDNQAGSLPVYKCGDGRIEKLDPAPSQQLFNHSPDGFQWGYSGSGPAQLALALLLDASEDSELSARWHQSFKFQFVSGWKEYWEISRTEIREWLKRQNTSFSAVESGA